MPRFNLPHETGLNFTEGPHQIVVYVAREVAIYIPMVLFAFFMIVTMGGFFLQERKSGRGDFPMWFSIGGYLTATLAIIFSLIDGLVNIRITIITIGIAIAGTLWFLISRD